MAGGGTEKFVKCYGENVLGESIVGIVKAIAIAQSRTFRQIVQRR